MSSFIPVGQQMMSRHGLLEGRWQAGTQKALKYGDSGGPTIYCQQEAAASKESEVGSPMPLKCIKPHTDPFIIVTLSSDMMEGFIRELPASFLNTVRLQHVK